MNRIPFIASASSASPSPRTSRGARSRPRTKVATEQSFFVPLHYEPNYAYPLLIWLHDATDDHRQLKRIMPHVSVRNYVAAAPAWTVPPVDDAGETADVSDSPSVGRSLDRAGSRWQDSRWLEEVGTAWEAVERVIEQAMGRFHIAPQRIFLAGVNEGGTMALRLGLAAPNRFAGVASLGGPFPQGLRPMAKIAQARRLPLLIAQGRDSEQYPVQQLCDELRLFHVAGMSLHIRQYPCGHELTTQMLADLDAWMMQIVTGVDMSASASASSDQYLPRSGAN